MFCIKGHSVWVVLFLWNWAQAHSITPTPSYITVLADVSTSFGLGGSNNPNCKQDLYIQWLFPRIIIWIFYSWQRLGLELGRTSGLATIFKFLLNSDADFTFKLQLFELSGHNLLLCTVVYRPPESQANLIAEFTEFLADIMPKYDELLIVWDFNIHVCCPAEAMVSFDLSQAVIGPTHLHGHTLLLFLSHRLNVSN